VGLHRLRLELGVVSALQCLSLGVNFHLACKASIRGAFYTYRWIV
jgi:hypothetical protein